MIDDMKMIFGIKYRKGEFSFQGEMIENEFYKSIDDMLDSNGDIIQVVFDNFFIVLYFKEKIKN